MDENSGCVSVGKERALVLWVWDTLQRQVWGFKGSVGLCSPFKPWPRERDGGAKENAQTSCWGPAVPHRGGGRWEMQGWLLLQAEDAILPPGAHTGGSPFRAAPCCTLHKEAAISAPGAGCKCRVLGPASSRGRRADEREAAGPKAKQKTELRSAAC